MSDKTALDILVDFADEPIAGVAAAELDALRRDLAEADGLVQYIEDHNDICPVCNLIHAHADHCTLAAFLKRKR